MEFHNIDIPEMEKQRYQAIKRTGEYVELNILIGTENDETEDGLSVKSPVVTTHMHKCGPEEVACLYMTLQSIARVLERKYPVECLMGKLSMKVEDMGTIDSSFTDNKDKED